MKGDIDTELLDRDLQICDYVKNGLSYSQIARLTNLSQGTICQIITRRSDYYEIIEARDKARTETIQINLQEDYKKIRTEKNERFTPEKIKQMTDAKLLWHENKIIGQLKTKAQMAAAIKMLIARVEELEKKINGKITY